MTSSASSISPALSTSSASSEGHYYEQSTFIRRQLVENIINLGCHINRFKLELKYNDPPRDSEVDLFLNGSKNCITNLDLCAVELTEMISYSDPARPTASSLLQYCAAMTASVLQAVMPATDRDHAQKIINAIHELSTEFKTLQESKDLSKDQTCFARLHTLVETISNAIKEWQ